MLSQYSQPAFQGFRGSLGGQQQFAIQTLRVHWLGIERESRRIAFTIVFSGNLVYVLHRGFQQKKPAKSFRIIFGEFAIAPSGQITKLLSELLHQITVREFLSVTAST